MTPFDSKKNLDSQHVFYSLRPITGNTQYFHWGRVFSRGMCEVLFLKKLPTTGINHKSISRSSNPRIQILNIYSIRTMYIQDIVKCAKSISSGSSEVALCERSTAGGPDPQRSACAPAHFPRRQPSIQSRSSSLPRPASWHGVNGFTATHARSLDLLIGWFQQPNGVPQGPSAPAAPPAHFPAFTSEVSGKAAGKSCAFQRSGVAVDGLAGKTRL